MTTREKIIRAVTKSESWKRFAERTIREVDEQILKGSQR